MTQERRLRSDGAASRRKILRAAADIAAERGYEGATISQVSKRSGLPSSSIYWHFADKDALIAEVVDDSFQRWFAIYSKNLEDEAEPLVAYERTHAAMVEFPDFLRLGLMLLLEHRPTEPAARKKFLEIRAFMHETIRNAHAQTNPDLREDQLDAVARHAMALADGYFLAAEAGELKLTEVSDMIIQGVNGALERFRADARPTP